MNTKDFHKPPGVREEAWNRFTFIALEETNLADILIVDVYPLELWDSRFLLFSQPIYGTLLW